MQDNMGRVYYYRRVSRDRRIMSDVWESYFEYSTFDVDTLEFGMTEEYCLPIENAFSLGLITKEHFDELLAAKKAKEAKLIELERIKGYYQSINDLSGNDILSCHAREYNVPCVITTARKYKGDAIFLKYETDMYGKSAVILTPDGRKMLVTPNAIKIREDVLKEVKDKLLYMRKNGEGSCLVHLVECFPYMSVSVDSEKDETPYGKRKKWLNDERVKLRSWVDSCSKFSNLSLEEKEKVTDCIMRKKYGTYE